MTAIEIGLLEKLKTLPPHRVAEVADFIDFLRTREDQQQPAAAAGRRSLAAMIGQGKGAFASPEEVDQFIRAERDQWP
jgi:Protein of unknown function (DUF2281)